VHGSHRGSIREGRRGEARDISFYGFVPLFLKISHSFVSFWTKAGYAFFFLTQITSFCCFHLKGERIAGPRLKKGHGKKLN